MEEKRKFPRYECSFQTRYSVQKDVSRTDYTISKDISKGGLCMPAADFLKEGDEVKLDFKIPRRKSPISATGKVVWTRTIPREAVLPVEAGIEFKEIARDGLEWLLDICAHGYSVSGKG